MANLPYITQVEPRLKLCTVAEHPIGDVMEGPTHVYRFIRNFMKDFAEENIAVLMLDSRNKPIYVCRVSTGTIDRAYSAGREILKAAVLTNSTSIIMAHNHISGDPRPSQQDIDITRKMIRCGYLMDIPLLDHIIVGSNGKSYSFLVDDRDTFHQMVADAKKEFAE